MAVSARQRHRTVVALVALLAALVAWMLWPGRTGEPQLVPSTTPAQPERDGPPLPRVPRGRAEAIPPKPAAEPEKQPDAPAEPAKEETFPFTVTVLSGNGAPAAGASVLLLSDDEWGDWAHELGKAKAGEDGVAALRVPAALARVTAWLGAEAHSTRDLVDVKAERGLTVRLTPAIAIRGRVVRTNGDPAAGAEVTVEAHPWFGGDFGLAMKTRTDTLGRFELPPVPREGVHPLNPPYVHATTPDLASGSVEIDPGNPPDEMVVTLLPGFTIRARILGQDAQPVAGARMHAWAGRQSHAVSGDDGRVELPMVRSQPSVVVLRPTGRHVQNPDRGPGQLPLIPWYVARSLGRVDGENGDVDLGDVTVPAGGPVVGTAVDAAGRAAGRVLVHVYLDDVAVADTVSDESGRFELPEVGPDAHRLYVREVPTDGSSEARRSAEVDGVKGGDSDVRAVFETSLLVTLRFLGATDRKPVASADIQLRVWRHGVDERDASFDSRMVGGDPEDSFTFAVREPGTYDLELVLSGHEPERLVGIEVVDGRPTVLDVLLRKKPN